MTGRNRNERLSDAQRSALWFLYRGEYVIAMAFDPAGGCYFRDKERNGPNVRRSVVTALVGRGILGKIEGTINDSFGFYSLTAAGLKVAREVADQIDPRVEGKGLA